MRYWGLLRDKSIIKNIWHWLTSRIAPKRHQSILRKSLNLPLTWPPELTVKLAESQDEVEESFEIVFDFCRSQGWNDPVTHNLLATKYHALPSTHIVIAKWNDEVVGTLTLVLDNPFLLPCEASGALRFIRQDHTKNVAEAFAFAVRPGYADKVTWPMIKYFVELARRVHNVDLLVLSLPLNSHLEGPIQALMFFKHQCHHIYDFYPLHNKLAVEVYSLDLENFHLNLAKHYWQNSPEQDLYTYIFRTPTEAFIFPPDSAEKVDWLKPPHLLDYLFNQRTKVFESLNEYEKFCLHSIYNKKSFRDILPHYNPKMIPTSDLKRVKEKRAGSREPMEETQFGRELRFNIREPIIINTENDSLSGEILDISLNGIRILCPQELQIGNTYYIQLAQQNEDSKPIAFQVVWAKKREMCFGLREQTQSPEWKRLVKSQLDKAS